MQLQQFLLFITVMNSTALVMFSILIDRAFKKIENDRSMLTEVYSLLLAVCRVGRFDSDILKEERNDKWANLEYSRKI